MDFTDQFVRVSKLVLVPVHRAIDFTEADAVRQRSCFKNRSVDIVVSLFQVGHLIAQKLHLSLKQQILLLHGDQLTAHLLFFWRIEKTKGNSYDDKGSNDSRRYETQCPQQLSLEGYFQLLKTQRLGIVKIFFDFFQGTCLLCAKYSG